MSQNDKEKFYFLAAGYVFFHPKDEPEKGTSVFLNGVIANDTGVLNTQDLQNGQRVLLQRLQERALGEVEVMGVEFVSISHLGKMTPRQFHVTQPEALAPDQA